MYSMNYPGYRDLDDELVSYQHLGDTPGPAKLGFRNLLGMYSQIHFCLEE